MMSTVQRWASISAARATGQYWPYRCMIDVITPGAHPSSPIFALVSRSARRLRFALARHRRRTAATGGAPMTRDEPIRRDVLQALAVAPFMALLAQAGEARAQV